jgi:dTDP-4-amino-4,6-dideoxygalactose transaminase
MKPLQLVDLQTQYQKIEHEINEAVLGVIRTAAFINGPEVKAFQEEFEQYLGVKHVIPCANGTDALQIALMGLDLEPGDEVITPSFTYIATAEVIGLLRLTPVFVEVDPHQFTIDPAEVRSAITSRTKAIIPVHLYGHCANMEALLQISNEFNIPLIEDTAQAIGSDYIYKDGTRKKAGSIGTIGCTSFFPSKNLGCYGDGGAIMTQDDTLAQKIRMIANHGQSKRYYHDLIGVNSRLDSIQAAILKIKLRHLDEYVAARQKAAEFYNKAFSVSPKITVPFVADFTTHGYHQYTLKLTDCDRDALMAHLEAKGIPSNIYYPLPIHLQKAFSGRHELRHSLRLTEDLGKVVLSLPIHTELDEEQLIYITSSVLEFINQ